MTLAGTCDLEAAAARAWDAVVVGAGPAGALAARESARRGLAVLLVDREPFPRWKVCGCCLSARALETLAAVGLGDLPGTRGALPLREVHLATRRRAARVPLPTGAALSRQALDAALVEAAVAAGAGFLPGTRAALGDLSAGGRTVLLRRRDEEVRVQARLVIAADGLASGLLDGAPGFRMDTAAKARVGAGAIADGVPPFYGPGIIFMACGRGGYLGLVRLEDGRLDLAAAFDLARVRHCGGPGRAAAAVLEEVGWPAIPGVAALSWRGTPRLTRRLIPLAGERLFALGDAAGYVEPFTGEGMAWALAGAAALAPLAARAARHWRPALAAEWAARHRHAVARRQHACRLTAHVLRHPRLVAIIVGLLAHAPGFAGPFVRYLHQPPATLTARQP
jgi:flavin-dependent dehydrogenase